MAEKILIVIDMQNDFIQGALGTKEAAAVTERGAEKIKNFSGRIFATMDTHTQDYLKTQEGKNLPVPHCIKGTQGWQLHEKILGALSKKNCQIIEKPAFGAVSLVREIQKVLDSGEAEVELFGLCTDICVVSNALLLKAHFPELRICVDADCCAGVSPKTHQAALETMKMCQIEITGGEKD